MTREGRKKGYAVINWTNQEQDIGASLSQGRNKPVGAETNIGVKCYKCKVECIIKQLNVGNKTLHNERFFKKLSMVRVPYSEQKVPGCDFRDRIFESKVNVFLLTTVHGLIQLNNSNAALMTGKVSNVTHLGFYNDKH